MTNIENTEDKSQIYQAGFNESLGTKRADLFLVILVLTYSGNPTVMGQPFIDLALICVATFLAVLMFVRHKPPFTQKFFIVAGLFGVTLFVQCVQLSFYPIITIAGFYTRLFIGYAIYRLVKNFPLVYVRAMFFLAIVSLVFYISREISIFSGFDLMSVLSPIEKIFGMPESPASYKLLLHTFMKTIGDQHRNAGMFWEPGAFAGYLILALIFLAFVKKDIPKLWYRRYLFILSATLLTTLSTAGYLVYPLVLLLHYDWRSDSMKKTIGRWLLGAFFVLPLIIIVFFYSYQKLDFLRAKIHHQIQSVEYREGQWYTTRFGSMVFDWEYIKRRPLTGWGLHSTTRYSLHPGLENSEGKGNGFSDFMAKFGISGMLIYLLALYRGMIYYTRGNRIKSLHILLIVMLVLQGEVFLGFPLFLGLMFLYVPRYSRSRITELQYQARPRAKERQFASDAG